MFSRDRNTDGGCCAVGDADDKLVAKHNDFSESPWLFLIILLVLVAEQALAVHLSFHLKGNEALPPAAVRPQPA